MSPNLQKQLFSQALAAHQRAESETDFRNSLTLYDECASRGKETFPIAFNTSAVCLSLSDLVPHVDANQFRNRAALCLDKALSMLPNNLEALTARAAVEDSFARTSPAADIVTYRTNAVTWLRKGAEAHPNDAGVRILLAESLILLAEACAEHPGSRPDDLLQLAFAALNEAKWLVEMRTADLKKQPANPSLMNAVQVDLSRSKQMTAKTVLAMHRLTGIQSEEARKLLIESRDAMTSELHEDSLILRAEILEALAEHDATNAKIWLREAISLCNGVSGERQSGAMVLLGDMCLVMARIGETWVFELGVAAYEKTVDMSIAPDAETLYNLACLISLGLSQGVDAFGGEEKIRGLLIRAVEAGPVTYQEMSEDRDLLVMQNRSWFKGLGKLARR